MSDELNLRILLPSRQAVGAKVASVNLTAVTGELGILPGHAALLAALRPGAAWYRAGETTERLALGDGFLEVRDDVVTVLVQSCERAADIDVERARRRKAECLERLRVGGLSEFETQQVERSVLKQQARLSVAGSPE